jgi:hypothetical protein
VYVIVVCTELVLQDDAHGFERYQKQRTGTLSAAVMSAWLGYTV